MKRKFTKLLAAVALLMFLMPFTGWGQMSLTTADLDFGTPQVSENFNSLSTYSATSKTDVTNYSSNGVFNKMYNNNTGNTYAIDNNTTFGANALKLTAGSGSPLIAGISKINNTAIILANTGAFSIKIAKSDNSFFGFYGTEGDNTLNTHANCFVYLKSEAGVISIHGTNKIWTSVGDYSSISGNVIEVCVVYNNTNTATTYGNSISLASKTAHIFINGSCVMNANNTAPKDYTILGGNLSNFRVGPIVSSGNVCTVDDVVIYNTLPTAASTTYTVSFDCDGGTANCPEDIEDLEEGEDFTIPSTAPTKDCYTFEGWYDDELTKYDLGETYQCPASDLALTAFWTLNKYTITYYSNNGETGEDVADDNLECGSAYTIEDNPGFTQPQATPNFVNWNTQAEGQGTTYAVDQEITISGNLNLYAQWSASAIYDVVYDCNGGTENCPTDQSYQENTVIQLPAAPVYANHTFNGWLDDAEPAVNHATGSDYTVTGDVYFTAQWLENLANPTFNVTGVSNGTANTYYVTATIEIEQEDGAYIYYTTDGTDPTDASTEYTAPFAVTNSCTIKAIAIFDDYGDSQIVSQEIIIVQPNEAEFTNGVYSETFSSSLGLWYAYSVSGNYKWAQGTPVSNYTGANINGYAENADNEDWLISPKMTVLNGKLDVSFKTAARYSGTAMVVKYSTDYNGYGNPNSFTWTDMSPSLSTNTNSSFNGWTDGKATISGLSENANVYVAFKYTSSYHSAKQYVIKDFSAKQCYPITYYANYENPTGSTVDANSPYAVGTEVTILANAFTAPSGKEFTSWNTQADGLGTTKNPGNKITMTTDGYELYAIWGDACVLAATMNATTGEAVYDYNSGEKRFNITPSSSVKTLGGCDIYDYGFVYSTTDATPEIDADNCTKVQVGETQPEVGVAFNTTLNGLTLGETYHVRSYATNAAGTAYSGVIDVAVPANFDNYRYEISYTTNGTPEASTYVYQGAPISGLLAAPEQDVPAGYTFMGWYGGDYALNNTAPTFVKNGDAIDSNLALKAVFAIARESTSRTGELTQSEITSNITSTACAYGTEKTYNDTGDGFTWIASCYADQGRLWMQIKKDASDAYVKIVAPDNITNIEILMTSTTNSSGGIADITKHNAFSGTVYLATSAGTSSTGNVGSLSSSNFDGNYANITPSGNNSTLYIQVTGGAARIWGISVTCGSVSYSYCTTVNELSGDLSGVTTTAGNAYYISAAANVPADVAVTINGALGNADASLLTINNGGQLIVNNTLAATLKKTIIGYGDNDAVMTGWYTIASPVNYTPAGDMLGNKYDLYLYDEANAKWRNYEQEGSTYYQFDMNQNQGYLYANSTNTTLSFAGSMIASNTSNVTVPLSYASTNDALKGINLVGNPFTRNLTSSDVIKIGGNNFGAYYIADGTVKGGKNVIACNISSRDIKPGEGFIVQASAAENLVFNYVSAKGEKAAKPSFICIEAGNEDFMDRAYVQVGQFNTLSKMSLNEETPQVFVMDNGKNFAATSIETAEGEIPVGFKASRNGQHTLTVSTKGLGVDYLHLIDNMTGADVDLLQTPSYSFTSKTTDYASRFRLVFSANNVNDDSTSSETFAFINGEEIVITNAEADATLQMVDMTGRILVNTKGANRLSTAGMTPGVYVIRMVNGEKVKTQKIVVR